MITGNTENEGKVEANMVTDTTKRFVVRARAWLIGLVVILAPGLSWAQLQPVPVFSERQTIRAFDAVGVAGAQLSAVYDVSGFTAANLIVRVDGFDAITYYLYGYATTADAVANTNSINLFEGTAGPSVTHTSLTLPTPYIRVSYFGVVGSLITYDVMLESLPSTVVVTGPTKAGTSGIKPVLVGGTADTGSTVTTSIVRDGAFKWPVGRTQGFGEVLIDVAATEIPAPTSGSQYILIQNLGPDPIYCGGVITGNPYATVANGLQVSTGQTMIWSKPLSGTEALGVTNNPRCITTVKQVAGAGTRWHASNTPNLTQVLGGGGGGGGTATGTMITAIPAKVSLAANVSGTICALTPEAYYRISCGAAATWRTGAATPTAVTTDNDLPASTLLETQLGVGETCIAFISSSAVDCKASLLTTP
jgi:hypothetical protein